MDDRTINQLTDGQRECLRRVLRHQTSKDIARELGISPHTVDQRLRVAVKTLGVSSRFEAAQRLAAAEQLGVEAYQSAVYQPPHIAIATAGRSDPPTALGDRKAADHLHSNFARERQLSYQAFVPHAAPSIDLPVPLNADEKNALGPGQRLLWIALIAIGTALGFGALVAGIEALGKLLRMGMSGG